MKERPILFSAPMVRSILEGRKTQTRRAIKHKPHVDCPYWNTDGTAVQCPHGHRLWVRETFKMNATMAGIRASYRADNEERWIEPPDSWRGIPDDNHWRPSIFMPRWASRITLEIASVRIERLKDITEEDAQKEGLESVSLGSFGGWKNYLHRGDPRRGETLTDELHRIVGYQSAVRSYRSLWSTINGPDSWDADPWVWVIEFRRIKP